MAMAEWAAHVEAGAEQATDEAAKLDTIQESLPLMPQDALRNMLLHVWQAGHSDEEPAIREAVDYWYRRALSAQSQARYPDSRPVESVEDWQKLPDRTLP